MVRVQHRRQLDPGRAGPLRGRPVSDAARRPRSAGLVRLRGGIAGRVARSLGTSGVFVRRPARRLLLGMESATWGAVRGDRSRIRSLGRFRVVAGTRPICAPRPARDRGVSAEAVDPSYYRNRSGQHFLLFKGSVGRPAHVAIWAYRMKKDAVTVASRSPHVVLRARAPGLGNTIENPQLVRHGGSSTCSARSTTGAAAATAPTSTPLVPTAASTGIRRRSIC